MNATQYLEQYPAVYDWESDGYHADIDPDTLRAWEYQRFVVTFTNAETGETFTAPWKQGLGIEEPPTAETVLETLAMDFRTVADSLDAEDFLFNLGYSTSANGVRAGFAAWRAIQEQIAEWRRVFGDTAAQALEDVEEDYED